MLRQKRVTPVRSRIMPTGASSPLSTAATAFVTWTVSVGLSADTARIRCSALERFVSWCHGRNACQPEHITHERLEGYQAYLARLCKRNGLPIAPSTTAARLNPVIAFCRWLVRQGVLSEFPGSRLVLPRQVRRLPARVPTTGEIGDILAEPDTATPAGLRDRAMMESL